MTGLSINISILIVDSVDREESTTLTLRDQQSDLYKQLITDDHDGTGDTLHCDDALPISTDTAMELVYLEQLE